MNLKFYEDKENENRNSNLINPKFQNEKNFLRSIDDNPSSSTAPPVLLEEIKTKKVFIESTIETLKKEHPNLNSKQLNTRANILWKNRQKLK